MNKEHILLVSHGYFENSYLEIIAEEITNIFNHPVKHKECHEDLTRYYDASRRQYDGNKLLSFLDSCSENSSIKTMGLFRVDLFIPILTYIFGQAIYRGKTGIASIYRLKNEQYGMVKDDFLLLERFRKVVIHELGHTFGLMHCYVPSCVMRSSTYVEDIDQKQPVLCHNCRTELDTLLVDLP